MTCGCLPRTSSVRSNEGWRGGQRIARPRAEHVVAQLRRPLAGTCRGFPAAIGAGSGPVRHAGHGQPGAAAAGLDGAGPRRAGRRRSGGLVGAQASRVGGLADGVRIRTGAAGVDGLASPEHSPARTARTISTCTGSAGSSAMPARSAAPSPAAPPRSNATSSPSGCWAYREIDWNKTPRVHRLRGCRQDRDHHAESARGGQRAEPRAPRRTRRRMDPRRRGQRCRGDRVARQRKTLLRRP